MIISDSLFEKEFADLKRNFSTLKFGPAVIQDVLYTLSAGAAYSAQTGLAALLKAVNDGEYNFIENIKEYGTRAEIMKKLFTENGFLIVYDKDDGKTLANGFYFTVSYPDYSGEKLLSELIRYGISAITLGATGSEHKDGLRICVSQTGLENMTELEERLRLFRSHHK